MMQKNIQAQGDQQVDQEINRVQREIAVEQDKQSFLRYVLKLLERRKTRARTQVDQRKMQELRDKINNL